MSRRRGVPEEHGGEESFVARWSRRKRDARRTGAAPAATGEKRAAGPGGPLAEERAKETPPVPTDADMPPLESLDAESDYSGFMSPGVSEKLRRAALRKLFHGAEFNVVDGLDDYAEDFTTFEALGDVVTADMRHQLERERERAAERRRAAGEAAEDPALAEPAEPLAEPGPPADAAVRGEGDGGVDTGDDPEAGGETV